MPHYNSHTLENFESAARLYRCRNFVFTKPPRGKTVRTDNLSPTLYRRHPGARRSKTVVFPRFVELRYTRLHVYPERERYERFRHLLGGKAKPERLIPFGRQGEHRPTCNPVHYSLQKNSILAISFVYQFTLQYSISVSEFSTSSGTTLYQHYHSIIALMPLCHHQPYIAATCQNACFWCVRSTGLARVHPHWHAKAEPAGDVALLSRPPSNGFIDSQSQQCPASKLEFLYMKSTRLMRN